MDILKSGVNKVPSKMTWANLQTNQCPKCDTYFTEMKEGQMIRCPSHYCSYQISYGKFIDLKKGKKSSHYKEMVKHYKSVDRYKAKVTTGYKKAIEDQQKERESNLNRIKRLTTK